MHTLALTDGGFVYSFGGGSYGQLGVKDSGSTSRSPVRRKEMRSKSIIILFF